MISLICPLAIHLPTRLVKAIVLGILLGAVSLFIPLHAAPESSSAGSWQEHQEGVTLNFEQAEIESVIAMVAARTDRNFIIDPRVRGEITIISHHPVNDQQLYQIFLSALQIHGFAAIPVDGATRIIPKNIAKRDQGPVVDKETSHSGYEFVTQVIRIEHVNASKLVPLLRPLVSDEAQLAVYSTTNTLIISESAGNIERIKEIIEQVDRKTSGVTEVVRLDNASASDIVDMVTKIEPEERAGRRLLLAADEQGNSVLVGGDPARRDSVIALIEKLDEKFAAHEGVAVIYLRYAEAESLVPVIKGLAEGRTGNSKNGAKVTIHAHDSTNSLVMDGPPEALESLRSAVNRLDIRRPQVLVEAIIAEVSADYAQELGIQWGALGDSGAGIINFSAAGEGSVANLARSIEAGSPPNISGLSAAAADRGENMGALLRALSSHADTNILSTPSVMTMDNQKAEIVVGQNVPFVTGRAIEESGQAFSSIQREDVGIKLKVMPQINEGDAITLEIEKEISGVEESIQQAEDLVTSMRSITTTAMVNDGQVMVLGGLMDEQVETTRQQVPLLGDIPGLGWLFSYQRSNVKKRNLMVFIRPRIVANRDDARTLTSPKYTRMRNQQLALQQRGMRFIDDDDIPVLDEEVDLMRLPPEYAERTGATGYTGKGRGSRQVSRPPQLTD